MEGQEMQAVSETVEAASVAQVVAPVQVTPVQATVKRFRLPSIIAVMIVVAMIGVAGTIVYFSNSVQANVTVQAPMVVTLNGAATSVDVNANWGDSFDLNTRIVNQTSSAVNGYVITTVFADTNLLGNEFSSVTLNGSDVLGKLYYIKQDGNLALYSTIGDQNVKTVGFIVSDTSVPTPTSFGAGVGVDQNFRYVVSDNMQPGRYSFVIRAAKNLS